MIWGEVQQIKIIPKELRSTDLLVCTRAELLPLIHAQKTCTRNLHKSTCT